MMFISTRLKQITKMAAIMLLPIFIVACGGGGSSNDTGSESSNNPGSGGSSDDSGSGGSNDDSGSGGSNDDSGSGGSNDDSGSGGSNDDSGSGGSNDDSGSGGSNDTPDNGSVKTISGVAQKGAFFIDSSVSAYQLDAFAVRDGALETSKVSDGEGRFSITPSWNDWAEVSVTGRFFNEDAAANSATELTLNSIARVGSEVSNVNLFTHFFAARLRYLLATNASNTTIEQAYAQTQTDLKNELSLLTENAEKLDITDGAGVLKNDNAILLLFSGGFMANNGTATLLLALSDDFANNGKFDDTGVVFFQAIANYAGSLKNLERLSNNLKQAGFQDPPVNDDLEVLPKWVNQAPLATLTPKSKTIVEGVSVRMDATASLDPEGGVLTYSWSGDGTGDCGEKDFCELNNLTVGDHQITLTVRDKGLVSVSDTASISVVPATDPNNIPVAIVEPGNQTVKLGLTAIFDASRSSDADGDTLSYIWNGPGTENCGNSVSCSISGLEKGLYFISVSVNDNNGGSNSSVLSALTVSNANVPPVANAGEDQTVTVDRGVELSGSGTDTDGSISAYEWKQGTLSIGTTKNITITNLGLGEHVYTFIVTDNDGATAMDTVIVSVTDTPNSPPVANAGDDKFITQGQSALLFGTGTDLDGSIDSYQWFEGGTLLGETADIAIPGLSPGAHLITLLVTDDKGGNDSDTVSVTVNSLNISVNISSTRCIVRLNGRHFEVSLTLQGGETGSGPAVVQEYTEPGCTGEKVGGEFTFNTTYSLTNITTLQADNSITTAEMTVSNAIETAVSQVFIVDGNVVAPEGL